MPAAPRATASRASEPGSGTVPPGSVMEPVAPPMITAWFKVLPLSETARTGIAPVVLNELCQGPELKSALVNAGKAVLPAAVRPRPDPDSLTTVNVGTRIDNHW